MMLSETPVWKKVFAMNKFHAETVPGRMIAQGVLTMFSELTTL